MPISVKVIFYKHKVYKSGKSPVVIQVIGEGKPRKKVVCSIFEKNWNENHNNRNYIKGLDNKNELNTLIRDELEKAEATIQAQPGLKIDDVWSSSKVAEALTFWQIGDAYIKSLKSDFTKVTVEGIFRRFKEVVGREDVTLPEITAQHLDAYIQKMDKKKVQKVTQYSYIAYLKAAAGYAKEKALSSPSAALNEFPLPVFKKKPKPKLSLEDLEKIEHYNPDASAVISKRDNSPEELRMARDMFLLAVYLRGVRIGDMIDLKQSSVQNGRAVYQMNKSEKLNNIKLIPRAQAIVDKYLNGNTYLFPLDQWQPNPLLSEIENSREHVKSVMRTTCRINYMLNQIAGILKIQKKVRSHAARHLFARLAIKTIGDPIVTMQLLKHGSLKIHMDYINELTADESLDEAADSIFG